MAAASSITFSSLDIMLSIAEFVPVSDIFCFSLINSSCRSAAQQCVLKWITTSPEYRSSLVLVKWALQEGKTVEPPEKGANFYRYVSNHDFSQTPYCIDEWVRELTPAWSWGMAAPESACSNDERYMLQWMTTRWAAYHGHVRVLKWLREEQDCPWGIETCLGAAYAGQVEAMQWLRSCDPPCKWDRSICKAAAGNGHIHMLKWLRTQPEPCPCDATACAEAAKNGQLETVQWLRDQGCEWDKWACAHALEEGRVDVLKWLRAQNPPCPWDPRICYQAAKNGDLDVLKWLRGLPEPCPWDEDTCRIAAQEGYLEILQWLRAQNPPCPWDVNKCIRNASFDKRTNIIEWIKEQQKL